MAFDLATAATTLEAVDEGRTFDDLIKDCVVGDTIMCVSSVTRGGALYTEGKEYTIVEGDWSTLPTFIDDRGNYVPRIEDRPFRIPLDDKFVKMNSVPVPVPTPPAMFGELSRDEKIELMTKWVDGAEVEINIDGDWRSVNYPMWGSESVYRAGKSQRELEIEELLAEDAKLDDEDTELFTRWGDVRSSIPQTTWGAMDNAERAKLILALNEDKTVMKYEVCWMLSGWTTLTVFNKKVFRFNDNTAYAVKPAELIELEEKRSAIEVRQGKIYDRLVELGHYDDDDEW